MKWIEIRRGAIGFALGMLLGSVPGYGQQKGSQHHVKIKDMVFNPPLVAAKSGDQIIWTNEDIYPHTVTSGTFDSGEIASGKTWSVTLKGDSEISYKCTYHPTMMGRLKASSKP